MTTICESTRPIGEYKIKMALLGPEESFKSAFRNKITMGNLSDHNKAIIGVTMGQLKVETNRISSLPRANVSVSLWDIECSTRFSMFRTKYYQGSEAIIVILDENTLEQAGPYCHEILEHNPSISLCMIILHEGDTAGELSHLNDAALRQFERVHIRQPQDALTWILDKFYIKVNQNLKQDAFGLLFLPKTSLFGSNLPELRYVEYACPIEHSDEINPHRRLNSSFLGHFIEKLGFPVHGASTILTNKFGNFTVSLREGNIQFTPRRCLQCKKCSQKQNEFICIIASSKGFSSNPEMTQAELLVVAKILALQEGDLPDHVLKQITRIDKCTACLSQ